MSLCNSWFCIEIVKFKGHRNIRATHKTTLEITKDKELTPRGDCIIGISSDKALHDFSEGFRKLISNSDSRLLVMVISDKGNYDIVSAEGHPKLSYTDENKIIIRKSTYIAGNTAGIKSNKSAIDINRKLINDLREGSEGLAIFIVIRKS